MTGWFKIQREIEDHWIWKSKEPFDKRSAWIDLIMLANYKDRRTMDGESVVLRKRGDVNYSMQFLAKRWQWDRRKVKRFLMALADDGMVSVNSTSHGTTITIENYAKHQDGGTADGTTDVQHMVQPMVQPMYTEEERKRNIRNKESLSYTENEVEKGQPFRDPVTGRLRFNLGR
jgi:DNA replication protein DnaD